MPYAIRLLLALLILAPAVARAQESAALADDFDDWQHRAMTIITANADISGDPLTATMIVCAGTACSHQDPIILSDGEAGLLRALFAGTDDAAAERQRIGQAIAQMENFTGGRNGTWADAPGNRHVDWDEPDQLDCVSEAVNTHNTLDRLIGAGLVVHHRLGGLVTRYTLLLQHVAVTIIDDQGLEFVVDSWVGANGEPPDILPYDEWRLQWAV
ncbi:MAG: hypothetical protein FD176_2897 [Rhodospirillaceae bacterium]|nr:MAG: hypothetical protein FD176_2897 [Rhodospirillaceae bacterium]TNC95328.1 MAG: Uncharacterized protein FD119_2452 [Stygiobacter sp.]